MPTIKSNAAPLFSAGAREERRQILAYVRRKNSEYAKSTQDGVTKSGWIRDIETWILGRQKRYAERPGGLGRK